MRRGPAAEVPHDLDLARRELEQWRQQSPRHKRLPRELWEKATVLARQHGVNKTAGVLRLNYDTLKQHVAASAGQASPLPAASYGFVELRPGSAMTAGLTCTIELDAGGGPTLRMQVQGATMVDLAVFALRLWNPRP